MIFNIRRVTNEVMTSLHQQFVNKIGIYFILELHFFLNYSFIFKVILEIIAIPFTNKVRRGTRIQFDVEQ